MEKAQIIRSEIKKICEKLDVNISNIDIEQKYNDTFPQVAYGGLRVSTPYIVNGGAGSQSKFFITVSLEYWE